jgi:very-short-patch-repair endonuclease
MRGKCTQGEKKNRGKIIYVMRNALHNRKELKRFRKKLRNNSTSAEATLWKSLKGSQSGVKFRRQHSVGKFVLDFYCATKRIAVELDGDYHFTPEQVAYDERRTAYLRKFNIKVIRFENASVFEDWEGVLRKIREACGSEGKDDGEM